jgi:hypothetical protein
LKRWRRTHQGRCDHPHCTRWRALAANAKQVCSSPRIACACTEAVTTTEGCGGDPSREKNVTGTRKYRALGAFCQACPSQDLCCPNADARYVTRIPDEDARDFARDCRKTKADKVSRDKRKKVEMLFAYLKRILMRAK